jgi:hypothetical protein
MIKALFDRSRHASLNNERWCESSAKRTIELIAADARKNFDPYRWWPIHPLDDDELSQGKPEASLYLGGAGVIWALQELQSSGAVEAGRSFGDTLADMEDYNRRALGTAPWRSLLGSGWQTRSWLLGDAGILFTRLKMNRTSSVLDALEGVIAQNIDDPSHELMWGAPGTMLAASALFSETGEARWATLFRSSAEVLEKSMIRCEQTGSHLWEQSLYGQRTCYLGAVHGFAGAAFALKSGRDLLPAETWRGLSEKLTNTIHATACRTDEGLNWPVQVGSQSGGTMLLQQCHGAPGMITCLAGLDPSVDELLVRAGDLVWRAGPLTKGSGLCHGTSGNGYALLRLFELTGDELWLDRARAFAMHAIRQSEVDAAAFEQRRYSLWTGDMGLACYLWDCVHGSAHFPSLDL